MSWESLRDLLLSQEHRSAGGSGWLPPVDLYETDNVYIVVAEVAGLTRDDLDINVRDGQLAVTGRRRGHDAQPEQYHRMERSHGSFERRFAFEHAIDAEHIAADLRDGVLTITVPKTAKPEPRRIKVE
jgi:HSP20 family protein